MGRGAGGGTGGGGGIGIALGGAGSGHSARRRTRRAGPPGGEGPRRPAPGWERELVPAASQPHLCSWGVGRLARAHRARARSSSGGGGTGGGARGGTRQGYRRTSPRRCLRGDGDCSPRSPNWGGRRLVVWCRQPGEISPRWGTCRRRRCGGGTAVGLPRRRRAPSAGSRCHCTAAGRFGALRGGVRQQRGSVPGAVVDRGRSAGDGAAAPRRGGSRRAGVVRGRHSVGALRAPRRGHGSDRVDGASGGAAAGTLGGTRRCGHRAAAGFR